MTPEQLALVRETVTRIGAAEGEVADRFGDRLADPSAAGHLLGALGDDPRTFVHEVLGLATVADDLPVFVVRARGLGRRLQAAGVETTDHPFLREALLDAVRPAGGGDWTVEVGDAWRCLLTLVSETMLEGAAAGLFSAPG